MNTFTYEARDTKTPLEIYEWDNVWLEHTEDVHTKRVLYIGDSISCGIRHTATAEAAGEWLFDGFGTSKAVDNPFLPQAVALWAAQEGHRDAVLVNNGLHGWHLTEEQYEKFYRDFLRFLKENIPSAYYAVVLTTRVADDERQARVLARNAVAVRLAEQEGFRVIDLFSVSEQIAGMQTDGVHFSGEGYVRLAKTILSELEKG